MFSSAAPKLREAPILPAEMRGKGPLLYSDIGKSARDLLYLHNHSQGDSKFTITINSTTDFEIYTRLKYRCINITSDRSVDADSEASSLVSPISYLGFLLHKNASMSIKRLTNLRSQIQVQLLTTVTVDEPAYPGLKTVFAFKPRFAKVELQYLQNYYGLTSSLCLAPNPTLSFSAALLENDIAVGGEVSFDPIRGALTKCNIGASFTTPYLAASLALNGKFDKLSASYYHRAGPFSKTAVGAEVEHSFSRNEVKITVGTRCAVNRVSTARVRVNNFGKASVVVEREFSPVSIVSVSAEVNTRSILRSAKFGLGLALKERMKIFLD